MDLILAFVFSDMELGDENIILRCLFFVALAVTADGSWSVRPEAWRCILVVCFMKIMFRLQSQTDVPAALL
jgi:hypothetical protein